MILLFELLRYAYGFSAENHIDSVRTPNGFLKHWNMYPTPETNSEEKSLKI